MNPFHRMGVETPSEQRTTRANKWRQPSGWKIHKVPPLIRRRDRSSGAYDPQVVSFGPYHHGKPELQTCEEVKHLALKTFVEGSNRNQEFFQAKVLEVISDARNCYIAGSTEQYTDDKFAEMMLLDSCFLIYLIDMTTHGVQRPQAQISYLPVFLRLGYLAHSAVIYDVFLMENQIPFQILMFLITLRYDDGEDLVCKFLQMRAWDKFEEQHHQDIKKQLEEMPPLHLLEALRMVFLGKTPATLVQLMKGYKDEKRLVDVQGNVDKLKHEKTFRSAKDLKAKGIHFRPSSTKSLKAINFNSSIFYGQLQLPATHVSSLWKVIFLNMIAYELCPNNLWDMTVMSYVNFMKSLIVSPADVKELREKRILFTSSTDEDVVGLFKDLDTYEIGIDVDNYREAKQRIQEHYDSKGKTWMAQLINTYFSTPWSIIGWLAGVVLLIFTVVQTCFTVNPRS